MRVPGERDCPRSPTPTGVSAVARVCRGLGPGGLGLGLSAPSLFGAPRSCAVPAIWYLRRGSGLGVEAADEGRISWTGAIQAGVSARASDLIDDTPRRGGSQAQTTRCSGCPRRPTATCGDRGAPAHHALRAFSGRCGGDCGRVAPWLWTTGPRRWTAGGEAGPAPMISNTRAVWRPIPGHPCTGGSLGRVFSRFTAVGRLKRARLSTSDAGPSRPAARNRASSRPKDPWVQVWPGNPAGSAPQTGVAPAGKPQASGG